MVITLLFLKTEGDERVPARQRQPGERKREASLRGLSHLKQNPNPRTGFPASAFLSASGMSGMLPVLARVGPLLRNFISAQTCV